MKKAAALLVLFLSISAVAYGQGKGIDQQNDRIRNDSSNRQPANNGGKQDTGAGRGVDFGRGRTPTTPTLPNPYRLSFPNDRVLQNVVELMQERKLILDDEVSKPAEGMVVSQPYTFSKGAVITPGELSRIADVPTSTSRGWTRGRYTIIVEVEPIDGTSSNVSVNARIEGRSDGVTGAEWITLPSNGSTEQAFIIALVQRLTGAPPPGLEDVEIEEPNE
ncbi:MAG TPA: hypothetical protein VFX96_08410 [Pyrinomonadaceae bacterium]|nr:hypothetical protein [Pyrinomonadaceae bacterium]